MNRTTAFLFLLFVSLCSCIGSIVFGLVNLSTESILKWRLLQSLTLHSDLITFSLSWGHSALLNMATDFFATAFVLLLLDIIISGREKRREDAIQVKLLTEQLIMQAGTSDNALASLALRRLKTVGAFFDGSLNGRDFSGSNWSGINLEGIQLRHCNLHDVQLVSTRLDGANLEGAILKSSRADNASFFGANLQGAELLDTSLNGASMSWANLSKTFMLTEQQLMSLSMLWGATMPDGERYDGRYDLDGDVAEAHKNKINYANPGSRRLFYDVDNLDRPS